MKTATAEYDAERAKLDVSPVYFVRFFHVPTYGSASQYPFARDFASDDVLSPTRTKLKYLGAISLAASQVVPEQGQASIGTGQFELVDRGGEILRYLSSPQLTLKTGMTAGVPAPGGYVEVNEDLSGLPAVGTIEVVTSGAIERVRYDLRDDANRKVRVAAAGRGADDTTAAVHNVDDPVTNGEQIRPGQRVQLYCGYDVLAEAKYMPFTLMEVTSRPLSTDGLTFVVKMQDVMRTLRSQIFLTASDTTPTTIEGNPVDCYLMVATSTGKGGYILRAAKTDLTGAALFAQQLLVGVEPATTKVITLGAGATADGYAYSDVGVPGADGGSGAQTYTAQVNPTVVNANISAQIAVARVNASGAQQATSGFTATQAMTALRTFSVTVDLGVWAAGDRLRVTYRFVNGAGTSQSVTIELGSVNTQVVPGWATATRNGAYDVLAAADGAATPAALVDVAGLEALRASDFAGQTYHFSMTGPVAAKSFLESLLASMNCYPVMTQDGKITLKRYKPAPDPATVTQVLTDDDILSYTWQPGDAQIINRVLFLYDWNIDLTPGDYAERRLYTFDDSMAKCGPRPTLQIDAKGLRTSDAGTSAMLDDRAASIAKRFAFPPPVFTCDVMYRNHKWEAGDLVKVTCATCPNMSTGLRGVTGEVFEILNAQPIVGPGGRLRLTLLHTQAVPVPGSPTNAGGTSTVPAENPESYVATSASDVQVFLAGKDGAGHSNYLACGVDPTRNCLSILQVYPSDGFGYWGRATEEGAEDVAMGAKLTGGVYGSGDWSSAVAGVGDANGDLHLALIERIAGNNQLDYARITGAGTVTQAPVLKFTGLGVPTGYFPAFPWIAQAGGLLYWVWVDKASSTTSAQRIRFATTDLTGAIVTAATTIVDHSGHDSHGVGGSGDRLDRMRAAVDADGNLHLLYTLGDYGTDYRELWYAKISSTGTRLLWIPAVISPPNGISPSTFAVAGAWVDGLRKLVILTRGFMGTMGSKPGTFHLGKLDLMGNVVAPLRLLFTEVNSYYGDGFTADPRNDQLMLVRGEGPISGGNYPVRLLKVARA